MRRRSSIGSHVRSSPKVEVPILLRQLLHVHSAERVGKGQLVPSLRATHGLNPGGGEGAHVFCAPVRRAYGGYDCCRCGWAGAQVLKLTKPRVLT